MIRRTRMPRRSPSSRCVSASCAGSSWRRSTVAGSPSAAGGGDVRDGGGREETAASSGDDRSVRERRSVVRRRRTTGENNDVGGEGKHAAQVHLTALLPQPPEVVEKVRQDASTNKSWKAFPSLDTKGVNRCVSYYKISRRSRSTTPQKIQLSFRRAPPRKFTERFCKSNRDFA